MNYDELRESLVDYFCRLEHGIEVAKIRAESVLEIVKVHADPAFILDCDTEIPVLPLIEGHEPEAEA